MARVHFLLPLIAATFAAQPMQTQRPANCPAPPSVSAGREPLLFSEEQEMFLGDAMAEQIQRDFRVIEDETVTARLQRIGDRLTAQLPPSKMRYRFFVVDIPIVNAFAFAGGRVYVTRKMLLFARSEDELAGVLGHEIGHILERQSAQTMSILFRELLGVAQLSDRADVVEKYHRFIENARTKRVKLRSPNSNEHQMDADRLGLYVTAAAGYAPEAYAELWDRLAETKGKTGNWFSEMFGFTNPQAKRLREILKTTATFPAACKSQASTTTAADFEAWKSVVVSYSGLGKKESLPTLVSRKRLEPPLGGELSYLKFSPDGKYILGQDDASVYVLRREPLATKFRFDAQEAYPAQFTPDSQSIVFYTPGLRFEKWSIADEARTEVREAVLPRGCFQTELSPDGKILACLGMRNDDLDLTLDLDLQLIDVATSQEVFRKKNFYRPTIWALFWGSVFEESRLQIIDMAFSPDGRYLLAGRGTSRIGIDLNTRAPIDLNGNVKSLMDRRFTFVGSDRLLGVEGMKGEKTKVVKFPSGEPLHDLAVGRASVSAPASGDYVLIRPIDKYAVGVMDLKTKKIFLANRKSAFDIFDRMYLSERRNGEIGLYSADQEAALATTTLPRGPLGRLRAVALAGDFSHLAVSERNRGAVWNLSKGQRVAHVRGFRGATFDNFGNLYADFPKFEEDKRAMARFHLATAQIMEVKPIEDKFADQEGPFLFVMKPSKEDAAVNKNATLEVRSASTGATRWTRHFPKETPVFRVSSTGDSMVLIWSVSSNAAKEAIKANPTLKARLDAMREKEGDYYTEVIDPGTGKLLGQLLIETGKGSFRMTNAFVAGDRVIVLDSENRVLVYSMADGQNKGRLFGARAAVSPSAKLLAVENETGQLDLYDLESMEKKQHLVFTSPVSWGQFSADGKRLFVLTADQTAYLLDTTAEKLRATAAAAAKN